ncbi:pyruvate/2-oxoglutarate dehydrogenase complex dihydrolipoamide dehydrogenase (E3) component [Propionicimonas paludicola]|uniref:Pyruvate/2-oxoglutarate dehydrogenase complex dihydrolipoamide dehydrogenase (E3) component n=1 Tax=Propionicimonas paludicola TaxID=185243 RepID=A0A2A9CTT0_9ACTN|nr:NAD(P)/FAD-dependent oxidoreductase [Propionicimonas paludicola]PFG17788.1 pyruvate/2-oxoglutarate dehydrogenase complex dihydrolipoamide dehydrogenase (E3) component [Propionicimonas paludicola]
MSPDADVIVVGLGVAGEAIAGKLAEAGLSVIGIEAELVGGECPYWGCIPTKMMIRAADALAEARRVGDLAGSAEVHSDWSLVAERIRSEATDNWNDQVAVDRLTDKGMRFLRGRATIRSTTQVEVPSVGTLTAGQALVVTTGTTSAIPPIPGLADVPYWTNRDAVKAETLPGELLIIGAGAIGTEIGQAWARFGVKVTLLDAADRPLAQEEAESGALLAEVLAAEGIELRLGVGIAKVSHDDSGFTVELADGSSVHGEKLLVATGRKPTLDADTWQALGLTGKPGTLPTDEQLRVGHGVWAAGDITGHGAFTHMATYQADIVAASILGEPIAGADYRAVPRVAFTDPEIGAVGMTEKQAREAGYAVQTGSAQLPSTSRGWIHKVGNAGFIKLVADTDADVLLGATTAGPNGGEILGALAVAVHARVPISTLETMIYAYPTFHRGILDAVRDLRAAQR